MKSWIIAVATVALAAFTMSGCNGSEKPKTSKPNETCPVVSKGAAAQKGVCPVTAPGKAESSLPARIEGTAIQTLKAGRYVYIELDTGNATSLWVAAEQAPVAKGDKVACRPVTLMSKFESPTLKRTFDQVYFVDSLMTPGIVGAMPTNHPPLPAGHMSMPAAHQGGKELPGKIEVTPAEGGVTIAAIASQQEKLAGTQVLLRGKVTKYSASIMGANWLHVQDGSDKRDLVVTTKAEVQVGDTVLIRGNLERNVDLGSGYSYDLIIRNAEVNAEKPVQP